MKNKIDVATNIKLYNKIKDPAYYDDPSNYTAGDARNNKYMWIEKKTIKELSIALDDWLNTFDPECDNLRLKDTIKRIKENGGTLAYIASLQEKIRHKKKFDD